MFFQLIKISVVKLCGRDSSVSVVTCYRVEGPRIESHSSVQDTER